MQLLVVCRCLSPLPYLKGCKVGTSKDVLRCSRAPFGTHTDRRTPSMHMHSHWAQQVFLRGHGWKVWPGDEIGFSVIWTDWAIQVVDVHIAKRAKLGKKMASQPQHQVWEPPSRLRVPVGGGEP
jgi:hypothetical protein